MIISHRHQYIFFCNGRTGTTSIASALRDDQEGEAYQMGSPGLFDARHIPPAIARSVLPREMFDTYFKFVFVRHPYDWFLSQWYWNFRGPAWSRGLIRQPRRMWEEIRRLTPAARARSEKRHFEVSDVDVLFDRLKYFRKFPSLDGFYQKSMAYDLDGEKIVDFVGKYESLTEDFREVMNVLGLKRSLPLANASQRFTGTEHLPQDVKERIAERWECDFEAYSYER